MGQGEEDSVRGDGCIWLGRADFGKGRGGGGEGIYIKRPKWDFCLHFSSTRSLLLYSCFKPQKLQITDVSSKRFLELTLSKEKLVDIRLKWRFKKSHDALGWRSGSAPCHLWLAGPTHWLLGGTSVAVAYLTLHMDVVSHTQTHTHTHTHTLHLFSESWASQRNRFESFELQVSFEKLLLVESVSSLWVFAAGFSGWKYCVLLKVSSGRYTTLHISCEGWGVGGGPFSVTTKPELRFIANKRDLYEF